MSNRPKRPPAKQEAQHRPNNLEREQQVHQALPKSEEKYRLIFDNSPALHVVVGIDGIVQDVNETLLKCLGYSKDDIVGKHVLDFVFPEDVENTATELAKALGNEKASEVEAGVYAKDRSVRTLLFPPMMATLRDSQGQVVSIIATGTDITERKRMEEALRQSEERYRTLFQQSNDSIYIVARAGILLDVNQAMCQLFGYSREEMLGMDIRKLYVNPAERTKFQNIIEKEGAVKDYELRFRNKDGAELECLVTSTVWHDNDGSTAGYRGTIRDITQRKQMEEAIQDSERQLKVILESTADGILAVNREGKVLLTNSRFAEMWRIPEELLQSKEDSRLLEYVLNQLADPDAFLEKVRSLYESLDTTFDHISFKDGRAFERYSSPLLRDGQNAGRVWSFRDITERKQMEEATMEAEERYRSLFERSLESVYLHDFEGNFVDANQVALDLLGYTREDIPSLNFVSLLDEEQMPLALQNLEELIKTGTQKVVSEFKLRRKDGKYVYIETTASVIHREGKPPLSQGIARDITKRTQMEEMLRQSEARYRTILDEMEDNYYEVDLTGNFTFVNEATCRTLGYCREELMKMNNRVYVAKEDTKAMYQDFNKVYLTGKPVKGLSYGIVRRDGTIGTGELAVYPLHNERGETIGFRGIGRDVTGRKKAEEMLQQSEQKLRNIFESVSDGVFTMDMNGAYTEVNQAMLDMHRLTSKNDLIGVNSLDCVAPSNMEEAVTGMQQTTEKGTIISQQFMSRRLGDGSEFPVEVSAKLLADAWGNPTGFVGVARDISQRKQAEEERQQLEQKAQLASRLASVGELAAGIAHEINNPLTSVIGYAQLLSAEENISADMKKDLNAIIEGANRVAGIVKRLLTFARQTKPQQTLVNVADLIATTLDLRAYHLRNSNIKVTTQLDPKLPIITADAGQLQQVFLNIIVNAETEMKRAHGKGKLLIKTEKVGKTIRISFEDNGPGIAEKNLKKIFDPFFTTKEVGEGTGLGLSICYGILAEHRGRIWAESEPGKGATFIVELPIVTKSSQLKRAEPPEEKTQKAAKAKILAVDDEPVILQLLTRMLTEEGYHVETAGSAAFALQMINKKRYNLILLDIKMPGMDGIQLYKRLQKMAPSLAKRVMFITGDVMGPETEAFLSQTRAPCATKPFDARQLKKEVGRLLTGG